MVALLGRNSSNEKEKAADDSCYIKLDPIKCLTIKPGQFEQIKDSEFKKELLTTQYRLIDRGRMNDPYIESIRLEAINQIDTIDEVTKTTGETEESKEFFKNIVLPMAEVVLSLNSITSTIQDSYEALSGKNLYDGSELSTFDRSFAILGVVTLGFGSKLGKGLKFIGKVFAKTPMGTKALGMAEKVLGTAQRIGVTKSESLGKTMGMLRDASRKYGNHNLGQATRKEAEFLGETWVGPRFRKRPYRGHPGHEMLVSEDGLKVFRPAVYKDRVSKTQANLIQYDKMKNELSNAHVDITD